MSGGVQSTDTNEDKESSGKSDKTTITFINGFTGGDGEYMTKIVDGLTNHKVIIILNSYRMQIIIQSSNQEILIC